MEVSESSSTCKKGFHRNEQGWGGRLMWVGSKAFTRNDQGQAVDHDTRDPWGLSSLYAVNSPLSWISLEHHGSRSKTGYA